MQVLIEHPFEYGPVRHVVKHPTLLCPVIVSAQGKKRGKSSPRIKQGYLARPASASMESWDLVRLEGIASMHIGTGKLVMT
jgi:hypothetical protein